MRIALICKRLYTNRDLLDDRFGRLYHIPVQLAKRGHEVCVIAYDYRRGRLREERQIEGVNFISLPAATLVNRLLMVPRLGSELRRFQPTVLAASGDTYLGALAALFARLNKIPWAFDLYDDYRYFASARIPGMIALFWKLVRISDHVFVASAPLRHLIREHAQGTVIENGIDPTVFRELDRQQCRDSLGIGVHENVVGFFGSIDRKRGIEVLMHAVEKIRSINENVRLLIAGKNSLALDMTGPGVDYRGVVSQSDVAMMINACSVVVVPYEKDPQIEVSNACKVAEYLACGAPIVATRVSNMEEVLHDSPEVLVEPGDANQLAERIAFQFRNQIRTPFPENLTWASLGGRVEQDLGALTSKGRP
jgi:glycosyltransferase involved in cell wall biosynthesis